MDHCQDMGRKGLATVVATNRSMDMKRAVRLDPSQLERTARMYRTNRDAAEALGVSTHSYTRACRGHGITTPNDKRRAEDGRRKKEREAKVGAEDQGTF